jgi:hypothetical protein
LESPVDFAFEDLKKREEAECQPLETMVRALREQLMAGGIQEDLPRIIYPDWQPTTHTRYVNSMMAEIELAVRKMSCDGDVITQRGIDLLREDHSGLRLVEQKSGGIPDSRNQIFAEAFDRELFLPNGKNRLSASFRRPASLAMSTRKLEEVSAPAGAFGKLSDRAQASLFDLGGSVATRGRDKTPTEVVKDVLKVVSPTPDPTFAESQRVELTISTALNTGGTDDRLEYVSAYIIIPPVPRLTTRGLHFEEEFLRRLRSFTVGHHGEDRAALLPTDVARALDRVSIRFNEIEKPQTTPQSLNLGTLATTGGTSLELSGSPPGAPAVKGTAKLEATRTDNLLKEIERRSTWIGPERTSLRVTQRGHEDVTVAGTIVQNLSLHVPRTSRLVMKVVEDKDERKEISISNVFQPLYPRINGLGLIVATVRVAVPTRNPWVAGSSGYAMTVVERPFWFTVWETSTLTDRLQTGELFPGVAGSMTGDLAVVLKTATGTDSAQFATTEDRVTFLDEVMRVGRKGAFGLQKVGAENAPEFWLRVIPCSKLKPDSDGWGDRVDKVELSGSDHLFGVEDGKGKYRGFRIDEMKPEPVGCRGA